VVLCRYREYAAGQRLLHPAVELRGPRFAACVVVDGEFATAPFLHTAGALGLPIVARLKTNLPELLNAAQKRFPSQAPKLTFPHGSDRVELWDAEDFDPWGNLRWETVRVMFYRQQKPHAQVIEAFCNRFPDRTSQQSSSVSPGQEPLGDRESRV
jgi:hypothetical protein